ncbi:MAG: tRNA 2-thiouridine(34) synthase MnmA [Patescibacteria group bacterium]|nr:tRNA 2-thiouridine(34) synthase MnmA [bacterium]MDZ4221638.1 tRNA 2-thiouridine(34) synthase MnmA [Patescibacteria group bacterium]
MAHTGTTIAVALSGGVDSAVSAALLKREGFRVVGFFMKNFGDTEGLTSSECPWLKDREDAMAVAAALDIPFETLDFTEEYARQVLDYFFREYQEGRTPNPDVLCNSKIKFGVFLDKAKELGADMIATGHYARKSASNELLKGVDNNKDQSYFLYRLNQSQLSKAVFPVGGYTKPEVRKMAKKFGLPNRDKADSQGVCFIGHVDLRKFLAQKIKEKPGDVVDVSGKKVGGHQGLFWYTPGQRKGINIGGTGPYYVVRKDIPGNRLVVTNDSKDERLYTSKAVIDDASWISGSAPDASKTYECRVRYREKLTGCTINPLDGGALEIEFQDPQWAVASGQSVVLYDRDACLGGGIVT